MKAQHMFPHRNDSEELGLKVQRAQYALEQARGVGIADGIRVIVDSQNRLVSVTVDEEDSILAAYRAALQDLQPKLEDAIRELRRDPRLEAISSFAEANQGRLEADRIRQQQVEDDDDYYERRNREGWLGN
jgi:hypothetical protein